MVVAHKYLLAGPAARAQQQTQMPDSRSVSEAPYTADPDIKSPTGWLWPKPQ
jgi:hypothetical protein